MNATEASKSRPIIVGEVLFDRFPDGTEVLGGAPFNVAWHLQGFGCAPLLISRVGNDARGERVLESMLAWGLDRAGLQVDAKHPTGLVDISFEGKHHTFNILPDQAYDHVDGELSQEALYGTDSALAYHGTLVMRTPRVRQVLDRLVMTASMPVFLDVNLRDPWWNKEELPVLLERARWVKVNDEELAMIAQQVGLGTHGVEDAAQRVRAKLELDLLIVTLGAQGALAFDSSNESTRVEPEQDTEIVDTVGAGDAFSSVVIFGLLEGWPVSLIMRKAQAFASRICAQRGATCKDLALYQQMTS